MYIRIKNCTFVVCVVFIVLSAIFYYRTFDFPKEVGPIASEYGSAFFPRFLLIFIMLICLLLILQIFLKNDSKLEQQFLYFKINNIIRVIILWVLCLAFYFLWKYFGYLYSSFLFIFAVSFMLGVRKVWILVFLSFAGPGMYLVFERLMKISL